jgi:hypothetical protein
MITQERVRELLDYHPDTGRLFWKIKVCKNIAVGAMAGCISRRSADYWVIRVDGYLYQAHRLAWLHTYGEMPKMIDHIDGDGLNNRISNLRLCTPTQNNGNMKLRKDSSSGHRGVCWAAYTNRWRALIHYEKKQIHIGYFPTKEEAAAAYDIKAKELFGDFSYAR